MPGLLPVVQMIPAAASPLRLVETLPGEPYNAIGRYFYLGLNFDV